MKIKNANATEFTTIINPQDSPVASQSEKPPISTGVGSVKSSFEIAQSRYYGWSMQFGELAGKVRENPKPQDVTQNQAETITQNQAETLRADGSVKFVLNNPEIRSVVEPEDRTQLNSNQIIDPEDRTQLNIKQIVAPEDRTQLNNNHIIDPQDNEE